MGIARVIPSTLKANIKSALREAAIKRALRPLRRRGEMSDREVIGFHRAWGNEGFAADPVFLAQMLRLLTGGPVLECGTGATTLLANEVGLRRGFETYSLEQDPTWSMPVAHWRPTAVRIIDAPLKNFGTHCWYDVRVSMPRHFSLIVCDGPYVDKDLGEPAYSAWRYGVLPWLRTNGKTFDILLLDDAETVRAPPMLKRWQEEFGVKVKTLCYASQALAIVTA